MEDVLVLLEGVKSDQNYHNFRWNNVALLRMSVTDEPITMV